MEKILHRVKAYLYDNVLTDDPNDYIARVSSERTLDVNDICTSAANRGGADISASAMSHAVTLFLKEMGYQLCDGYSVNTGYFMATTLIRGVFNSPAETFDSKKHYVKNSHPSRWIFWALLIKVLLRRAVWFQSPPRGI
jgi:hypothetical protein